MSYNRSTEDKKRLIKLYNETKNSCCAGAYFCDRKQRLIKYTCASPRTKRWHKKKSWHEIRKQEDTLQRSAYQKMYDYWWNML